MPKFDLQELRPVSQTVENIEACIARANAWRTAIIARQAELEDAREETLLNGTDAEITSAEHEISASKLRIERIEAMARGLVVALHDAQQREDDDRLAAMEADVRQKLEAVRSLVLNEYPALAARITEIAIQETEAFAARHHFAMVSRHHKQMENSTYTPKLPSLNYKIAGPGNSTVHMGISSQLVLPGVAQSEDPTVLRPIFECRKTNF